MTKKNFIYKAFLKNGCGKTYIKIYSKNLFFNLNTSFILTIISLINKTNSNTIFNKH